MSRTDKDAPAWVRGNRARPTERSASHAWNCDSDPEGLLRRWRPSDGSHRCDLDDPRTHGWRDACSYWPEDRHSYRQFYCASDYKVRINLGYYSPERAHVRDSLRAAARDYNTHGETDVEPISRQGRRSPWYGGYWD